MNIERTLEPSEAILAMLDGEILYLGENEECFYDRESKGFRVRIIGHQEIELIYFSGLHRKIMPKNRYMTRIECLFWATSKQSIGWLVRRTPDKEWVCPQFEKYDGDISGYQRVRISTPVSGVYEIDVIESFEVEE